MQQYADDGNIQVLYDDVERTVGPKRMCSLLFVLTMDKAY